MTEAQATVDTVTSVDMGTTGGSKVHTADGEHCGVAKMKKLTTALAVYTAISIGNIASADDPSFFKLCESGTADQIKAANAPKDESTRVFKSSSYPGIFSVNFTVEYPVTFKTLEMEINRRVVAADRRGRGFAEMVISEGSEPAAPPGMYPDVDFFHEFMKGNRIDDIYKADPKYIIHDSGYYPVNGNPGRLIRGQYILETVEDGRGVIFCDFVLLLTIYKNTDIRIKVLLDESTVYTKTDSVKHTMSTKERLETRAAAKKIVDSIRFTD